MKIKNIKDVEAFLATVDKCRCDLDIGIWRQT